VTADLDALVFQPTDHQVAPGSTVTTGFTIAVTDTAGQTASDSTTSVVATAVAAPPTITGTVANQAVHDNATIDPFAHVTVTDANAGQTETVTITPSNIANGTLSDPNAATDGSAISNGVYTVTGTAAAVTADLDALVFQPTDHQVAPGSTVTTGFTIAVTDTAGQTASDSATSVVATAVATAAEVNTWFQTIDGLPATAASISSSIAIAYVGELNATPPTATPAQIQADLENFPFNSSPPPTNSVQDTFYRTSVADFVLREFQLAWGVVPTSGSATSQYDAWVARVIDNPSNMTAGGMSQALAGTTQFMVEIGATSPTQGATLGMINTLCANAGVAVGPGAMANVNLPIWQVLQNFAESRLVSNALAAPIANFQNLLLAGETPTGSDMVQLIGVNSHASLNAHIHAFV
jgi:plastocyanin